MHPDYREIQTWGRDLVDAAGVRSQRAFIRGAKAVSIVMDDFGITATPTRNLGPKAGFEDIESSAIQVQSANDHDIGVSVGAAFALAQ